MIRPALVISLDFELHWGRFDKYDLESNLYYYKNTKEVIPRLLDLFHHHGIQVTWATVGMLMAENLEEWRIYQPSLLPSFQKNKFSAYRWLESQTKIFSDGLFAPDLVKLILDCPGQELGSHSFSHYFSLESGQSIEQWKEDIKAAQRIAKEKFGKSLESLVFPRNQYSKPVIEMAQTEGFCIFRTNPADWFWRSVEKENLIKKVFRTGDTLIPLGACTSYPAPEFSNGRLNIPASRILRPYRMGSLFNQIRIARIKKELELAIEKGETYHLWWHPHNFGNYPEENLRILEELLIWVKSKVDEGCLSSESMVSLSRKIALEAKV